MASPSWKVSRIHLSTPEVHVFEAVEATTHVDGCFVKLRPKLTRAEVIDVEAVKLSWVEAGALAVVWDPIYVDELPAAKAVEAPPLPPLEEVSSVIEALSPSKPEEALKIAEQILGEVGL